MSARITNQPFQQHAIPSVWGWLQEWPTFNFDDYAPRTLEEFRTTIIKRLETERMWLISKDGRHCGAVAYLPIMPRLGSFHGIVFGGAVRCSREEKREAVRSILDQLFAEGVQKVMATFFADNQKIDAFLKDLGAVHEGRLRRQTLRNGRAIDMIQVAIFAPEERTKGKEQ